MSELPNAPFDPWIYIPHKIDKRSTIKFDIDTGQAFFKILFATGDNFEDVERQIEHSKNIIKDLMIKNKEMLKNIKYEN